jgi:excisionase family DNA binding protein
MQDNSPQDAQLQELLKEFLTPTEIATALDWMPKRLGSRIDAHTIACTRSGSAVLIHRGELERLRNEQPRQRSHPTDASLEACEQLKALLQNYVSVPEAARLLNLTDAGVRSKIKFGTITAVHVGTHVMIPRSEISRIRYERWPGGKKPRGK